MQKYVTCIQVVYCWYGILFQRRTKACHCVRDARHNGSLYGTLDEDERIEVEKLFRADLNETGREAGITREEFAAAMQWLETNQKKHVLEDDDIALIKRYFEEHLAD